MLAKSLLLALIASLSVGFEVPKMFRGSSEIFSGYLPNSDKFVESFTYTKGLTIVGNSTQVEQKLANSDPQGKFHKNI